MAQAGSTKKLAAQLTKDALLRNLDIAKKLDCLDREGLAERRTGNAPTIRRGPYRGGQLSVDYLIPRSVCPELGNCIANLELMSLRMNSGERDCGGERQRCLAVELYRAGLVSG